MTANIGDKVECMGFLVEIGKILHQEFWPREGWDLEFIDTSGGYHHWKQWDDGGRLIQKEKRAYDCYGMDVTDLYRKYNQPL